MADRLEELEEELSTRDPKAVKDEFKDSAKKNKKTPKVLTEKNDIPFLGKKYLLTPYSSATEVKFRMMTSWTAGTSLETSYISKVLDLFLEDPESFNVDVQAEAMSLDDADELENLEKDAMAQVMEGWLSQASGSDKKKQKS